MHYFLKYQRKLVESFLFTQCNFITTRNSPSKGKNMKINEERPLLSLSTGLGLASSLTLLMTQCFEPILTISPLMVQKLRKLLDPSPAS